MTRFKWVASALLVGFALATPSLRAGAAEPAAFTQSAFDALNRAGKPVVVDVAATWCPTCKAQKPIVDQLARQAAYRDVAVLRVDFDTGKPALREFHVSMQSTLIAFHGGKEAARSVGDTTPAGIERLFAAAVR